MLYGNGLLDRLLICSVTATLGEISYVVSGCADDVAVLAENKRIPQFSLYVAVDFSRIERFLLQIIKCILLQILQVYPELHS